MYAKALEVEKPTYSQGEADAIMNAYVNHGAFQLTRQSNHITKFYYYETRGARGSYGAFDSGLLEVAGSPVYPYKTAESDPRSIYPIYAKKTPTGP